MVQLLDYVMELLRDGRWHHVHTITIELNQPEEKIDLENPQVLRGL